MHNLTFYGIFMRFYMETWGRQAKVLLWPDHYLPLLNKTLEIAHKILILLWSLDFSSTSCVSFTRYHWCYDWFRCYQTFFNDRCPVFLVYHQLVFPFCRCLCCSARLSLYDPCWIPGINLKLRVDLLLKMVPW